MYNRSKYATALERWAWAVLWGSVLASVAIWCYNKKNKPAPDMLEAMVEIGECRNSAGLRLDDVAREVYGTEYRRMANSAISDLTLFHRRMDLEFLEDAQWTGCVRDKFEGIQASLRKSEKHTETWQEQERARIDAALDSMGYSMLNRMLPMVITYLGAK